MKKNTNLPLPPNYAIVLTNRRALVAQLMLNSGGTLTLEELQERLQDEHGIAASKPTLCRDLEHLRRQQEMLANKDATVWREEVLGKLRSLQDTILSRGESHPDFVVDMQRCLHQISKIVGLYDPTVLNGQAIPTAQLRLLEELHTIMDGLTEDNFQKVVDFAVQLASEQSSGVESEVNATAVIERWQREHPEKARNAFLLPSHVENRS